MAAHLWKHHREARAGSPWKTLHRLLIPSQIRQPECSTYLELLLRRATLVELLSNPRRITAHIQNRGDTDKVVG